MHNKIKNLLNIENEFFKLDEENKIAKVDLHYKAPSEIFSQTISSKIPIVDTKFMETITRIFEIIPNKYKVDFDICFDDLENMDEEELRDIFRKCFGLEIKAHRKEIRSKNIMALYLIGVGTLFVLGLILLNVLWNGESVGKQILNYILEIGGWVAIWGGLEVFIIENRERRRREFMFAKRFNSLSFKLNSNG